MYNDIVDFLKENIKNPDMFKNTLFYTKEYPSLDEAVLDDEIIIINAIDFLDYQSAYDYTKVYLADDKIFPFLDTLCGNLICIGYGTENKELIYYFDMDFGIFQLEGDDFHQFCTKLKPANYEWL